MIDRQPVIDKSEQNIHVRNQEKKTIKKIKLVKYYTLFFLDMD